MFILIFPVPVPYTEQATQQMLAKLINKTQDTIKVSFTTKYGL